MRERGSIGLTAGKSSSRIAASAVCVLVMILGALLLGASDQVDLVSLVAGSGLLIGASSLFLGIGLWAGGLALALRAIGWLTLVVTLSVPSTLVRSPFSCCLSRP